MRQLWGFYGLLCADRAPARSLMRTPKLHAALLGACGWPFCPSRQHPRVTWRQPFSTPSHSAAKCRDGREVLFPGPSRRRQVQPDGSGLIRQAQFGRFLHVICLRHVQAQPANLTPCPEVHQGTTLSLRGSTTPSISISACASSAAAGSSAPGDVCLYTCSEPPPEESLRNLVLGSERS